MKYSTDLMREILKSANGQQMIDFVAPVYGESYTALWLFEIMGRVMDNVTKYADSLQDQILPQTATWSLPYWEKEYNITPDSSWTIAQRQAAVLAKMKYVPPINPAKLAEFSSAAAGVPCKVIENVSKNTFEIRFDGSVRTLDRLVEVVDAAKPAHLIWNIHLKAPAVSTKLFLAGMQFAQHSRTPMTELEPDRAFSDTVSVYGAAAFSDPPQWQHPLEPDRSFAGTVPLHYADGSPGSLQQESSIEPNRHAVRIAQIGGIACLSVSRSDGNELQPAHTIQTCFPLNNSQSYYLSRITLQQL